MTIEKNRHLSLHRFRRRLQNDAEYRRDVRPVTPKFGLRETCRHGRAGLELKLLIRERTADFLAFNDRGTHFYFVSLE